MIKLPYKDLELAGLFSFSVLTHIHPDNFRAWFKELARVLKPGALAYLTFNGDTITEFHRGLYAKTADEFRDQGAAWLEQPGNYKSAAFLSHDRFPRVRRGYFRGRASGRARLQYDGRSLCESALTPDARARARRIGALGGL